MTSAYTVQLGHGLGLIEETPMLLALWQEGMNATDLYRAALASGQFPKMSARRLRDFVAVGFAPRYLRDDGELVRLLKRLMCVFTKQEFTQLLYLYTCRAHAILADFVREVYWPAYAAGKIALTNQVARDFTDAAVRDGKTTVAWSDGMAHRNASNLTGALAEFGLLEPGRRTSRKILPFRIELRVAAFLAYDLHTAGMGDNRIIHHPDWTLFGLTSDDVLAQLKQLALRGYLLVQSAAGAIRITWPHKTLEEFAHALAAG